jgi:hypothetical protein
MKREYPRFLFSNPKDSKSKGPFIVHLIKPRMVAKVYERRRQSYNANEHPNALHFSRFAIELLEAWDEAPRLKYAEILSVMNDWLWRQIETGKIELIEPPDDRNNDEDGLASFLHDNFKNRPN